MFKLSLRRPFSNDICSTSGHCRHFRLESRDLDITYIRLNLVTLARIIPGEISSTSISREFCADDSRHFQCESICVNFSAGKVWRRSAWDRQNQNRLILTKSPTSTWGVIERMESIWYRWWWVDRSFPCPSCIIAHTLVAKHQDSMALHIKQRCS